MLLDRVCSSDGQGGEPVRTRDSRAAIWRKEVLALCSETKTPVPPQRAERVFVLFLAPHAFASVGFNVEIKVFRPVVPGNFITRFDALDRVEKNAIPFDSHFRIWFAAVVAVASNIFSRAT